jgi:hypothetical protein
MHGTMKIKTIIWDFMLQQLTSTMGPIQSLEVALKVGKTMCENWDKIVCFTLL